MRHRLLAVILPLVLAGCLTPFTSRLDEANARAAQLNDQLIIATAKLDDATRILKSSEGKLDDANVVFHRLEARISSMDVKFTTIEEGFRKMFGIKKDEEILPSFQDR